MPGPARTTRSKVPWPRHARVRRYCCAPMLDRSPVMLWYRLTMPCESWFTVVIRASPTAATIRAYSTRSCPCSSRINRTTKCFHRSSSVYWAEAVLARFRPRIVQRPHKQPAQGRFQPLPPRFRASTVSRSSVAGFPSSRETNSRFSQGRRSVPYYSRAPNPVPCAPPDSSLFRSRPPPDYCAPSRGPTADCQLATACCGRIGIGERQCPDCYAPSAMPG